jgi:Rrf2 family iron-sulfur cluster assembly transcriptional regulator
METEQSKKVRLTPRDRHALIAMAEIAGHSNHSPASLPAMAATSGISLSYLEKLFVGFRRSGLVKSFRGCNGGYALARPADQISISEILSAVDESASRNGNGNGHDAPAVHAQVDALMAKSEEILYAMLQHLNLADIVSHRVDSHPFLKKTLEELR